MVKEDLVYVIPAGQYGKEGVLALLEQHPEIKYGPIDSAFDK